MKKGPVKEVKPKIDAIEGPKIDTIEGSIMVPTQRAGVRLNEKKMQRKKFFQNPLLGYPWSL